MKIETRYNIGDEAWIMFSNRPEKQKIHKIEISVLDINAPVLIKYWLSNTNTVLLESQIIPTKEELLASL